MTAAVYSSPQQLKRLAAILQACCRLPMSGDSIPGAMLETTFANVRNGRVLATYDYVDVIDEKSGIGWSLKSTKATTPMTWKRGKIPNKTKLMDLSHKSDVGLQQLGNSLITFCNEHAKASLEKHKLSAIGYGRLIVHGNLTATYFERVLCTANKPEIFDQNEFEWKWSVEKVGTKKEQLSALHGIHKPSGKRWWAWHGKGENQLHFTGESHWWPAKSGQHAITFALPSAEAKLTFDDLLELLKAV